MSIPLVQNNEKDSINTSIIAIKRQIERINTLLGLSNSEEIDTSVFATKDELQQAVTDLQPVDEVTADNMQSVTSNAVRNAIINAETPTITTIEGEKRTVNLTAGNTTWFDMRYYPAADVPTGKRLIKKYAVCSSSNAAVVLCSRRNPEDSILVVSDNNESVQLWINIEVADI
jgi:hypothetical protein